MQVSINDLNRVMTKASRAYGIEYPATETPFLVKISADRTTITIFKDKDGLTECNTFSVGESAEWGSYNLSYYGVITSITEKTVTITHDRNPSLDSPNPSKIHRLSMSDFCWRNEKFNVEAKALRNSETMMYI